VGAKAARQSLGDTPRAALAPDWTVLKF